MADEEPLSVEFTTLDDLAHDMKELSIAFDNSQQPLTKGHDDVITGAGQFVTELQEGAAQFLLAWEVAFRTMSDGAALVGNNIGKSVVDLKATDVGYSSQVRL
jgi:hypothetical protein